MASLGGRVGKFDVAAPCPCPGSVLDPSLKIMNLKVAIFRHAYVRDLEGLGEKIIYLSNDVEFSLGYFYVPGATFGTFIDNLDHFTDLKDFQPHYIIVVLEGNDLQANIDLSEIYKHCSEFYGLLRASFPDSVIIASQIENRFYNINNRFCSPGARLFDYLRRNFNKHLKNKSFKDFLLQVQGPNHLDNRINYRDAVHLSPVGLRKYFEIIRRTLDYAYSKRPS